MSRMTDDLQRLICEERFAELAAMLLDLLHYPPEQARESLRSALIAARARRAHYVEELTTLQQHHVYLDSIRVSRPPELDVTG